MRPPYTDTSKLGFGQYFTDHMFVARYETGKGWYEAKTVDYNDFKISPAASVLHYSQEVFEGMKAYRSADDRVLVFRPEQNARRMNRSAQRICLPTIPEELFLQGVKEVVLQDKEWIPGDEGTSLYIRPTMIGDDGFLGIKVSNRFTFFIVLSPVGPYYKEGFNPIPIYVEDQLVRACVGGVGDIKTGGNYAASLLADTRAKEKGFTQVLWLDSKEHRYAEEVGSMNIFFVMGNKVITPALNGSILPGITRDSVLTLAPDLGYEVEERAIPIQEILEGIEKGTVTECFGSGTAAVISPVGSLHYKGVDYELNGGKVGEVTANLYHHLVDIQYGRVRDPYGWVNEIGRF